MERYTIYPKDVYKGALILVNQEHPLKEFAGKTWKARAITEQYKNVLMEAVYMNEQGICLEEYIELMRRYPYGENCLKLQVDEKTVEVSYLKMEGEAKEIMLPKQKFCQISGNNVDGVILTLWEKRDGKA